MTENKVFWEKTSDYNVWFCNGWKEFAKYLSLGDSQLTLFQYQENSVFNVIVCGKCGLEIKYPLKETNKEHEEVEESDTSLQIIEDPSSSKGKRLKSSPPYFKKMKINSKEQKEPKHEKRKVQEQGRFHNFKDTDNGWFYSILFYFFFIYLYFFILFFRCYYLIINIFFGEFSNSQEVVVMILRREAKFCTTK